MGKSLGDQLVYGRCDGAGGRGNDDDTMVALCPQRHVSRVASDDRDSALTRFSDGRGSGFGSGSMYQHVRGRNPSEGLISWQKALEDRVFGPWQPGEFFAFGAITKHSETAAMAKSTRLEATSRETVTAKGEEPSC